MTNNNNTVTRKQEIINDLLNRRVLQLGMIYGCGRCGWCEAEAMNAPCANKTLHLYKEVQDLVAELRALGGDPTVEKMLRDNGVR